MKIEWKNTRDLHNSYCYIEECPHAMKQLLLQYKWFFDDDYFYWLVPFKKWVGGKPLYSNVVKRRPLYFYPQKRTPTEKVKYVKRPLEANE